MNKLLLCPLLISAFLTAADKQGIVDQQIANLQLPIKQKMPINLLLNLINPWQPQQIQNRLLKKKSDKTTKTVTNNKKPFIDSSDSSDNSSSSSDSE